MLRYLLVALVGAAGGFLANPQFGAPVEQGPAPAAGVGTVAARESLCDVDQLAARLAPALSAELAAVRAASGAPPGEPASPQRADSFARSLALVDDMIVKREVTSAGLQRARIILQESGQAHREGEMLARISAAFNRGELTAEEAGLAPR